MATKPPSATDPLNPDTDEDRLLDGLEIQIGTDPLDDDTDDGGSIDGDEVEVGTDPLDPSDDIIEDTDPVNPEDPVEDPDLTDEEEDRRRRGGTVVVDRGCGCNGTGGAPFTAGMALLLLGLVRRRR